MVFSILSEQYFPVVR